MSEEFKGAMSPETEKTADEKFKFKNFFLEAADGTFIKVVDNYLFDPLLQKLPEEMQSAVKTALAEVIAEMPVVEI